MEQFYYDRQQAEPMFPRETLLQKAEDYLKAEQQYKQVFSDFRTANGTERESYAQILQSLHIKMQMLRNTYALTIGGLHGQEISGQESLYDPAIHTCTELHGNVGQGDPIRFLNTAICASDESILVAAQGVRVY